MTWYKTKKIEADIDFKGENIVINKEEVPIKDIVLVTHYIDHGFILPILAIIIVVSFGGIILPYLTSGSIIGGWSHRGKLSGLIISLIISSLLYRLLIKRKKVSLAIQVRGGYLEADKFYTLMQGYDPEEAIPLARKLLKIFHKEGHDVDFVASQSSFFMFGAKDKGEEFLYPKEKGSIWKL